MEIQVTCGDCGKAYRVPDKLSGKVLKCKKCGAAVPVPVAGGGPAPRQSDTNSGGQTIDLSQPSPFDQGDAEASMDAMYEAFAAANPGLAGDDKEAVYLVNDGSNRGRGKMSPMMIAGIVGGALVVGAATVVAAMLLTGGVTSSDKPSDLAGASEAPTEVAAADPAPSPTKGQPTQTRPRTTSPSSPSSRPASAAPTPTASTRTKAAPKTTRTTRSTAAASSKAWQFELDPLPVPDRFVLKPGTTFTAKLPLLSLVFPARPSPYVLMGDNDPKKSYAVYDFRNGRKVGGYDKKIFGLSTDHVALSPDGGRLVVTDRDIDGHWPVHVIDPVARKKLNTFKLSDAVDLGAYFMLVDDRKMVVTSDVDDVYKGYVGAYDLDTGKVLWEHTEYTKFTRQLNGLSPGGRYVALAVNPIRADGWIDILEVQTGKKVARFDLPEGKAYQRLQGFAFSPDGRYFATIYDAAMEAVVWDLKTGKQVFHDRIAKSYKDIDREAWAGRGGHLQFVPGTNRIVLRGRYVFDLETKQRLADLTPPGDDHPSQRMMGHCLIQAEESTRSFVYTTVLTLETNDIAVPMPGNKPSKPGSPRSPGRPSPAAPRVAQSEAQPTVRPAGPRGAWEAAADPATDPKLLKLRPGVRFDLGPYNPGDVSFSSVPSPFLLAGKATSSRDQLLVVDLRTGRPVGSHRGQLSGMTIQDRDVSPDGKRFALAVSNHNRSPKYSILVFDARRGLELYRVNLPKVIHTGLTVRFTDADSFLVMGQTSGTQRRYGGLFDAKAGELRWQRDDLPDLDHETAAISPGGKYFVAFHGEPTKASVDVFRVADGQRVGRLDTAANWAGAALGYGFSPDGSKLVGVSHTCDDIEVWDMANGQRLAYFDGNELDVEGDRDSQGVRFIGDGPLVSIGGVTLMNIQTGQKITDLPEPVGLRPLAKRVIGEHMLAVSESDGHPKRYTVNIQTLEPVFAEAKAAIERARPDIELSTPTPLDDNSMRRITARSINTNKWPLTEVDPAPAAAKNLLLNPIPIIREDRDLTKLRVFTASSANGIALAWLERQSQYKDATQEAYLIDLTGGKPQKRIKLPLGLRPLALSPDGSRAAFAEIDTNRLHILELSPLKNVANWEISERFNLGKTGSVLMVDNDHLWITTGSNQDPVFLASISENRMLASAEGWTYGFGSMTPGGRYLVVKTDQLQFIDPTNGKVVAALDTGPKQIRSFDISADGKRLAVTFDGDGGGDAVLATYDLTSGKQLHRVTVPCSAMSSLRWVSDDLLMMYFYLVDSTNGLVLWKYKHPDPRIDHNPTDRIWGTTGNYQTAEHLLFSHTLPHAGAARVIKAANLTRQDQQPLIQPGDGAKVTVTGVPGAEDYRKELEKQLIAGGLAIADNAPFTFEVTRNKSSETKQYSRSGLARDAEVESVNLKAYSTQYRWFDTATGKTLWKRGHSKSQSLGSFVSLRDDQSLQELANQQDASQLFKLKPPVTVWPPAEDLILGRTSLFSPTIRE